METGESAWTQEHFHRLFTAMKANIPENKKRVNYRKTLETLNWDQVAVPPFSPNACKRKWSVILQKMRKSRCLIDLLNEAEEALSNPLQNQKLNLCAPNRARPVACIYFQENHEKLRKKHPELKSKMLFKLALKQFKDLPQEEKACYMKKFKLEAEEHKLKMNLLRNSLKHSRKGPQSSTKDVASKHVSNKCDQGCESFSRRETQKFTNQCHEGLPHLMTKKMPVNATSDSEDEDLEDSSSEDDQHYVDFNETEDDEDEDMKEEVV